MPLYVYVFIGVTVVSAFIAVQSYLKVLRLRRRREWREYLIEALCTPLSNVPTMISVGRDEDGETYTTLVSYDTIITDVIIVGLRAEGAFERLRVIIEGETFVNVKDSKLELTTGRIPPVFFPAGTKVDVTLAGVGSVDLLGYEVPVQIRADVHDLMKALSENRRPVEVTPGPPLS